MKLDINEVRLMYCVHGMNLLQVAKFLGVNVQELRTFCIQHNIIKDKKIYDAYQPKK